MKLRHGILQTTSFLLCLLLAASFGVTSVLAQETTGLLDGKVFVGDVGDRGNSADDKDEVSFKNGRFHSVGCDEWGFGDAPYSSKRDGDTIRFQAITVSPTDGKIEWEGVVKGDTLEATYVWTKERRFWKDAHEEMWFSGNLKN